MRSDFLENRRIRNTYAYKKFVRSVLDRDNYKCTECSEDDFLLLQVHHIKPMKTHIELATEISNGVTLCKKCHKRKHPKKEK